MSAPFRDDTPAVDAAEREAAGRRALEVAVAATAKETAKRQRATWLVVGAGALVFLCAVTFAACRFLITIQIPGITHD